MDLEIRMSYNSGSSDAFVTVTLSRLFCKRSYCSVGLSICKRERRDWFNRKFIEYRMDLYVKNCDTNLIVRYKIFE